MNTRIHLWIFAIVLLLAPSGVALGQVVVDPDHLKCYQVKDAQKGRVKVDLITPQFGDLGLEKECVVSTHATLFCAPTAKCITDATGAQRCDDPNFPPLNPDQDFLCYKVRCPNPVTRRLKVFDQFSPDGREIGIEKAKLLCTPARKEILGID
jgi:hypothetical protein